MKTLIPLILTILVFTPLMASTQKAGADTSGVVYQTGNLVITRLSGNVYQHTSFFKSETFGKVPCNGMVVTDKNEAVIFDTPADNPASAELIKWIQKNLKSKINAVIATHFHEDCVGGLREFNKSNIPSYARRQTIELAKSRRFPVPSNGFDDSLSLRVGGERVYARFFGEGHTRDNVVGYFPSGRVLFGGCLVKELGAGKGNLEDANVKAWPFTVAKVKEAYPEVRIVIPGHGAVGDKALLDYTIRLFDNDQ